MTTKDNSGALFKEEKKSDKHPDYKGSCVINGTPMYIAAWINESKAGKKYMSLNFSSPSESAKYSKETSTATPQPTFAKPETDDIPF